MHAKTICKYICAMLLLPPALEGTVCRPPRHAASLLNVSACTWTCASGFFKTAATETCKPCATAATCGVGWRKLPCTPLADARCERCAPLAGALFTESDSCATTTCQDGWHWENQTCRACPVGAYCSGGVLQSCGTNCSTPAAGAVSSLQCLSTAASEIAFSVTRALVFSLFDDLRYNASSGRIVCAAVDAAMVRWLDYGSFHGCHAVILSSTMGTATCVVSSARCVAGDFLRWLLAQLDAQHATDAARWAACLGKLVMGAPLVQQTTILPTTTTVHAHGPQLPPPNAPPLTYVPWRWGHARSEVLASLLLVAWVHVLLLLVLAVSCALACTRRKRGGRG